MAEPNTPTDDEYREFLTGYIDHLLLTTLDADYKPLRDHYNAGQLAPETRAKIEADCRSFLTTDGVMTMLRPSRPRFCAQSFLESRNGHGVCCYEGPGGSLYYNNTNGDSGEMGLGFSGADWLYYGKKGRELAPIAQRWPRFKLVPHNGVLDYTESTRDDYQGGRYG